MEKILEKIKEINNSVNRIRYNSSSYFLYNKVNLNQRAIEEAVNGLERALYKLKKKSGIEYLTVLRKCLNI